ncbi:enolase C-terminal domain-like protein [Shigella flexneri]
MFSRFDFKRVLRQADVDSATRSVPRRRCPRMLQKIPGMAEAYDVTLAPHCPLGPIALAACLHIDFVSYNAVLTGQKIMGIHYNKGAGVTRLCEKQRGLGMVGGFFKPLTKKLA